MQTLILLSLSCVIVIDLYLAQHSSMPRREVFYGVAALMLFAALMVGR